MFLHYLNFKIKADTVVSHILIQITMSNANLYQVYSTGTIGNSFPFEIVQKCQHCQLCVLWENWNGSAYRIA